MRRFLVSALCVAPVGSALAQGPTPGSSEWRMTGQTNGILERAFGPGQLSFADGPGGATDSEDSFTTTQAAGIPDIGGVVTPILAYDKHIDPEGYHMRPLTGQTEDRFTLVYDLYQPLSSNFGDWSGLWQSRDNLLDCELHLEQASNGFWHDLDNSGVGSGSGGFGSWSWDTWFRVAYVVDGPANSAKIFVDGVLVMQDVPVDQLPDGSGADVSWILTDQNNNHWPGFLAAFAVVDAALTDAQVAALGAPHPAGIFIGEPVGSNYCGPANLNSSGSPGVISGFGSLDVPANFLELTGDQLPQNQFAMFVVSQTQGFFIPPGSQGNLCLAGNIGRLKTQLGSTGTAGSFTISVDLTDIPVNPPVAVSSGETWNFQLWFRDIPATSNFTDGLSITFN